MPGERKSVEETGPNSQASQAESTQVSPHVHTPKKGDNVAGPPGSFPMLDLTQPHPSRRLQVWLRKVCPCYTEIGGEIELP